MREPTADKTNSKSATASDMTQLKKRLKKFIAAQEKLKGNGTAFNGRKARPRQTPQNQKPLRNNVTKGTANNGQRYTEAASNVLPKETVNGTLRKQQKNSKQKSIEKKSKQIEQNKSDRVDSEKDRITFPQSVGIITKTKKKLSNKAEAQENAPKPKPTLPQPSKASPKARKRSHPTESSQNKKIRRHVQELVTSAKPTSDMSDSSYDFEDRSIDCDNSDVNGMLLEDEGDDSSDFDDVDSEGEEESDTDCSDYEGEEEYTEAEDAYSFETVSDDYDYELPEDVPEDLIVHRGTAIKRSLQTEDDVEFDSDSGEAQIVEICAEQTVKCIQQPQGYAREELLRLSLQRISLRNATDESPPDRDEDDGTNNNTDCPQLVPILDNDGFQLYNPAMDYSDLEVSGEEISGSLSSNYEECTDDDSVCSVDVNNKYMMAADSSDEEPQMRQMRAHIIAAENFKYAEVEPPLLWAVENKEFAEEQELPLQKVAGNGDEVCVGEVVSTNIMQHLNEMPNSATVANDDTTTYAAEQETEQEEHQLTPTQLVTESALAPQPTFIAVTPTQPFHTIFCNAIDATFVLVLLKDPFHVYGTVKLTLLAGSIEVYGHSPRVGDELEVFSPRGCSVVQVRATTQAPANKQQVELALSRMETYFLRSDLLSILDNFSPATDAVLLLKRNAERKKCVNNFKKYMNENVFPNMNSVHTERPFYASESLLRCIINTDANEKALRCPPQWSALFLEAHSRMLLVGGKSVGKSTLLRFLVNRHIHQHKRILLIDLDIGQPEMFVPQTVSCFQLSQPLLGPGFFLNRQPAKAYMVGHANVVLCAHAYLRAVKQLLHFCHTQPEYAQLPWLINTMGYNKGFGLELIAAISELLRPTDVVQLQSNKEINNFDVVLHPQFLAAVPHNIYGSDEFRSAETSAASSPLQFRLHLLGAAVPQESRFQKEWDMSPKDLRYAMMLARLSDALQGNAEWLTDCKPLCAPLDRLKLVNTLSSEGTEKEVLQAIEANLVYLCHWENVDSPLECFGVGVVRGVDHHVQQLYILPAMPFACMSSVNCLAIGEMPLPTSMFTNQGPKVVNIAPFVYNTIDEKASKAIKQIYHRPQKFLTGKHREFL